MQRLSVLHGRIRLFGVLLTACLTAPQLAAAQERIEYGPGDKLARGAVNILLGFTEIPYHIDRAGDRHGLLAGWTAGLAKGLGYTGLRMVTGAYEVVTFPFPIPANYVPIMRPAYPWQRAAL